MNTNTNKIRKNNVLNRFLPVPETVLKGLEPEPKITDFKLIKDLGVGSFGRVFLVQHNVTQAQYAIKAIDKRIKDNIDEKLYFKREMEIMYKIHHPNVVKLFGHFEDNTYCYFIMEYMNRGNLYSFCPKNGVPKISKQTAASLIKDVISALYFLHHMNPPIIHRDIKPENILINDQMRAKLTDFGWSNYLRGIYKRTTICGTPIYLAPEIIFNFGHDQKLDIWCLGVLMFELLAGQPPWKGDDVTTVKRNISSLNINWPKNMDPDAKDLISKILKYLPEERPTLEEILMHPFFTKFFPDAVNCLKTSDNSGQKLYLISKDHPLTYNSEYETNSVVSNLISPTVTIPNFTSSITPSNYNSLKFSSIPNTDYTESRGTIYSVSPLSSIDFTTTDFIDTSTTGYLIPSISHELVETEPNNNSIRNTYTLAPLKNSEFPIIDYNPTRTTYTMNKQNNTILQPDYNIIRSDEYNISPFDNFSIKELTENEERIEELVGPSETEEQKNYISTYQNLFNNYKKDNSNPIVYQTPYRTIRTTNYAGKNLNINNNNIYNSDSNINNEINSSIINNNKFGFSLANNRFSYLNTINLGDINSFQVMNDPDIIKIREHERQKRENERNKLNTLMKKYGMTYTPIYTNKYNFI